MERKLEAALDAVAQLAAVVDRLVRVHLDGRHADLAVQLLGAVLLPLLVLRVVVVQVYHVLAQVVPVLAPDAKLGLDELVVDVLEPQRGTGQESSLREESLLELLERGDLLRVHVVHCHEGVAPFVGAVWDGVRLLAVYGRPLWHYVSFPPFRYFILGNRIG